MIPLSPRQSRGKIAAAACIARRVRAIVDPGASRQHVGEQQRASPAEPTYCHYLALQRIFRRKWARTLGDGKNPELCDLPHIGCSISLTSLGAFTSVGGSNGKQDTSRALRCHDDT